MNNYLTRLVTQILINHEECRDDYMLTIKMVHDRELKIWWLDTTEYYNALFSNKLSNVQTIGRLWRLIQEKRPELRGKSWEDRQKKAGAYVDEELSEMEAAIQTTLFEDLNNAQPKHQAP